jgi:RNA polymerase sigma-70 factor (ECF subfamily)
MDEGLLIQSILKGNSNAFGILVDQYAKLCFSIAYRISNSAEDAQDIVQDSFISAYENLREFKQDAKFSTWLYRITLNKALAFKKKQSFFEPTDEIHVEDHPVEEELHLDNEKKIKTALKSLNENERLVIDLYYYQEQSIKEISIICALSEANVKVIMHRARKKMNDSINLQPLNL